jgi:hypothetical protein
MGRHPSILFDPFSPLQTTLESMDPELPTWGLGQMPESVQLFARWSRRADNKLALPCPRA